MFLIRVNTISKITLVVLAASFLTACDARYIQRARADAYYGDKDYQHAFALEQQMANQGDANAQNNLGVYYENGLGVAQDYSKALYWYQKAADQGNALAQSNLGNLYMSGQVVTQDYTKAFYWLQKAADQGNANAQSNLGFLYMSGLGVAQHFSKAVYWFQKAVEQGNIGAMVLQGGMYYEGKGVFQNKKKAADLFLKAQNSGETNVWIAFAKPFIGSMYILGEGVEKNIPKGVNLISESAESGNDTGQTMLGVLYLIAFDFTNPNKITKNLRGYLYDDMDSNTALQITSEMKKRYNISTPSIGIDLIKKSADQGNDDAQYILGNLYYEGNLLIKDEAIAISWLLKSAKQENKHAQVDLGKIYENKNDAQAEKYYQLAADQANALGMYRLGLLYKQGKFVEKNLPKALGWLKQAVDYGEKDAIKDRDEVQAILDQRKH